MARAGVIVVALLLCGCGPAFVVAAGVGAGVGATQASGGGHGSSVPPYFVVLQYPATSSNVIDERPGAPGDNFGIGVLTYGGFYGRQDYEGPGIVYFEITTGRGQLTVNTDGFKSVTGNPVALSMQDAIFAPTPNYPIGVRVTFPAAGTYVVRVGTRPYPAPNDVVLRYDVPPG